MKSEEYYKYKIKEITDYYLSTICNVRKEYHKVIDEQKKIIKNNNGKIMINVINIDCKNLNLYECMLKYLIDRNYSIKLTENYIIHAEKICNEF